MTDNATPIRNGWIFAARPPAVAAITGASPRTLRANLQELIDGSGIDSREARSRIRLDMPSSEPIVLIFLAAISWAFELPPWAPQTA